MVSRLSFQAHPQICHRVGVQCTTAVTCAVWRTVLRCSYWANAVVLVTKPNSKMSVFLPGHPVFQMFHGAVLTLISWRGCFGQIGPQAEAALVWAEIISPWHSWITEDFRKKQVMMGRLFFPWFMYSVFFQNFISGLFCYITNTNHCFSPTLNYCIFLSPPQCVTTIIIIIKKLNLVHSVPAFFPT